jgi:hypothetical protein
VLRETLYEIDDNLIIVFSRCAWFSLLSLK